jgi:hypothetical protein
MELNLGQRDCGCRHLCRNTPVILSLPVENVIRQMAYSEGVFFEKGARGRIEEGK